MEISQERIRKFWEKCGFRYVHETIHFRYYYKEHYWQYPNGDNKQYSPPIDLNNLFKYAVPKLENDVAIKIFKGDYSWIVELWKDNIIARDHDKDPATALFLAIEKVI
ncbi:hypothetical protein LCGC14_2806360 [marine sediment metagenome]|uniref:Phage ABA sandwich domain-containing protein n=1 Tax=marine sediment metagenome TaxID=412755 RepID=A0A0F8Z7Z3_9ZZZZ